MTEASTMKIRRQDESRTFQTPNALVTPLATTATGSDTLSVIRQRMEPGHQNPMHSQTAEEVLVLLAGTVTVVVAGESATLGPGDTLIVPAGTPHSVENAGDMAAEWLIISPAGMQFQAPDGTLLRPDWAA